MIPDSFCVEALFQTFPTWLAEFTCLAYMDQLFGPGECKYISKCPSGRPESFNDPISILKGKLQRNMAALVTINISYLMFKCHITAFINICNAVFLLLAKYHQMANFFSKMLILAIFFQKLIFLLPKSSSNLTISHPIWPFFIHSSNFSSKSRRKCCTFYFIGATRSINENLQNKHWCNEFDEQPSKGYIHTMASVLAENSHKWLR
jgi:hypothetical protein